MKKDKNILYKRNAGRKTLLLALVLLLALSPVSWGGVFGLAAETADSGHQRTAGTGKAADQMAAEPGAAVMLETVYADDTGGTGDGSGGGTGSGGSGTITQEPTVKVVGVNVKNTDTLEVGIQVGGPDQPLFQSVGLVLEYDKTKLKPIDWEEGWKSGSQEAAGVRDSETGGEAESPTGPAVTTSPSSVRIVGEEDWQSLAVYTPTWINSGTAQVYESAVGPGDGSAGGAGTGSGNIAGTAEKGYLLLQANTEYPYSLPTARQIVTVKFQYLEQTTPSGGAIVKAGSFADVGLALAGSTGAAADKQAGKQVAFTSRIGHVGLYSASNSTSIQQFYHTPLKDGGGGTAADDSSLADRKLIVNLDTVIEEGETQQAAGGGTGNVAVLSFYDWDETMLGSSIISQTAGEEEIKEALTAFSQSQYAVTGGGAKPTEFPADLSQESYVSEADGGGSVYPLTFKKGYNFAGWVRADGKEGSEALADAFTAYETLGEASAEDGSYPEGSFNAARWKYETGANGGNWGNIVLKAGYVENATCNQGSGASYYTISDFSFNRYGASANDTAGNYSVQFTARRQNTAGNGVTRTREIGLRMVMMTENGGVQIYTLSVPENKDAIQAETVVPKSMKSVTITVIEQAGASNYTAAKGRSITNNTLVNKNTSSAVSSNGFVYEGTITFINEQGIASNQGLTNSWVQVNARAFIDAKLTNSDGSEMTTAQANVGKRNLLAALAANGNQPLTQAQMLHAVRNSGELIHP